LSDRLINETEAEVARHAETGGMLNLAVPVDEAPATATQPEREFTVKARSQRQIVFRRFVRHRVAMVSLVVLVLVVLLAFVGAALWKYEYTEVTPRSPDNLRGAPSLDVLPWIDGDGLAFGDHPFGVDNIGRDYFALTLRGAQRSLLIAFMVGLVSTVTGTLVGALAGFYRGWTDQLLMRFTDVVLTIPLLLIAAVLGRRYGGSGITLLAVVIGFTAWTTLARVIRGEFLSLREKEFVESARAIGASNRRIILKHMLPNTAGTIIVNATLVCSVAILLETALSFLGLGVRPPDTSLGTLVSEYENAFNTRPWLFWWPGLFIIVTALCINFIGDGLRDAFDPRQTRVRA